MAVQEGYIARSEVEAWLRAHGGQKGNAKIEYISVANANYEEDSQDPRKSEPRRALKRVTWTANDDTTLVVIDDGQTTNEGPRGLTEGPMGTGVSSQEPVYEIIGGAPAKTDEERDNRSPESRANEERLDYERKKNLRETGKWETDAQREAREEGDRKDAEARAAQATRDRLAQGQLEVSRGQLTLAQQQANKPSVLGTPTDTARQIAIFNPQTGRVEAQQNPLYDAAKAEAAAKMEELTLAIQLNRLTAEQAAAEYTRWFKQNVEVPFMMSAEARAQAAEKRQALEAEERRRQFAASNQIQRAQVGQQAAGQMLNAEMALNPYRVGPKFGEQMSAAVTSLAQGGTLNGPSASAGINFTKEAFEYDAPDLKKIARDATKQALKGITPYQPSDEQFAVAEYEGIALPNSATMAGAPAAPNYTDTNQMYQDWLNRRYQYAGQ